MKIAIDAGHGLHTAGKRCPDDSMREFQFNCEVARLIYEEIKVYTTVEGGAVQVCYIHAEDGARDVPLHERVKSANEWKADIYVSIHANAAGTGWNDANGIETFTAKTCSDTSSVLAKAVQKRLVEATGRKDRGVKREDFTVIAKTDMPAILVEAGFMTNREEAALLKSTDYRKTVAAAVVRGLADVCGLRAKNAQEQTEDPHPSGDATDKTAASVNMWVNGKELQGAFITDGSAYAPVRALAEMLGATVRWDASTRTIYIDK
ncbi:N-acetylmuramoyl-L-alanine amidase [Paenibacillus sp. GCM10027627]|uniref:N-acetylmuramoyl-L-alanine amidase n=1 Tax=unclassified Paenibacillus TaxID=185978 RepID=UPI00362C190B